MFTNNSLDESLMYLRIYGDVLSDSAWIEATGGDNLTGDWCVLLTYDHPDENRLLHEPTGGPSTQVWTRAMWESIVGVVPSLIEVSDCGWRGSVSLSQRS